MPYNTKNLLTDASGIRPIPQAFNDDIDNFEPVKSKDGALAVLVTNQGEPAPYPVLQEQRTDKDEAAGRVEFSEELKEVDIYNMDTNEGTFTVNELDITIPGETFFNAEVGGVPSKIVKVSGSTSYIIGRYA